MEDADCELLNLQRQVTMHPASHGRFSYPLRRFQLRAAATGAGILLLALWPAFAQDPGPMAAPPKFETKTISTQPTPGPPPIPLPTLIQQVAQHEDAIERAYLTYSFQQEARITESPGINGRPGEFNATVEVHFEPDGARYAHILKHDASTLGQTHFTLGDIEDLASVPMFTLTTAQLPNYNITYEGDEKLDEIHTYILRVQPKQLERSKKRFDGVVWVDDHDLAVVKSYGRFISDVVTEATLEHPFTDFEIYRENITSHYWFPTYIRSDNVLTIKDNEIHMRLVLRSSNFQLPPTPGAAAPPATTARGASSSATSHATTAAVPAPNAAKP